jgi:plasmid maintenance system killer protein
MQVLFKKKALQKQCSSEKARVKCWGKPTAKKLGRRLDDLAAASCLEDMRHLPGRCHELTGNLAGLLAIDLVGSQRLILEPADEPIPRKDDSGLDWSQVLRVRIVRIEEDYHG